MSMSTRPHSRRVLVDSSAYFALAVVRDTFHELAEAVASRLEQERCFLFATNFVIAETYALLVTRAGGRIARAILQTIDASAATTFIRVSARDERRAREIIFQYDDKDFSLT